MIKKILVIAVMTLVVTAGVLGVVSTTHAQELEPVEVNETPEELAVPVVEPEEAAFEYEYAFQYGEQNGDNEPILTQTRTRTQLRDLQDGECTGESDPQQLRLNTGAGNQGVMKQQQLHLNDGTCDGDCVPQGQGGQGR